MPKAHTKGGIVGYHRRKHVVPQGEDVSQAWAATDNKAMTKKEYKKHHHGKRREKLRIINKHLDQHPDF